MIRRLKEADIPETVLSLNTYPKSLGEADVSARSDLEVSDTRGSERGPQ